MISPEPCATARRRHSWDSWYPGDDVVDWMGVSQFMTENYLRENGPYDCERGVNLSVVAPREVQDAFLNYARGP